MPSRAVARRRNRKPALDKLKAGSCADCTLPLPPDQLCFIHARPPALFSIANHARYAWPDVLAEIAKCDVVCRPCCTWRLAVRAQLVAAMDSPNIVIDPKGDPVRERVVLEEGIRLNAFHAWADRYPTLVGMKLTPAILRAQLVILDRDPKLCVSPQAVLAATEPVL